MKDELTTVYLLGDSITQGLGSKKINFTNELARLLGSNYEIVNLAQTGTTIDYAFKIIDEGKIASGGAPCASCCTVTWMHRYDQVGRVKYFPTYLSGSRAAAC